MVIIKKKRRRSYAQFYFMSDVRILAILQVFTIYELQTTVMSYQS